MKESDLSITEAINFIKDDYPDLDFDFINWLVTGVKDHEAVLDEKFKPYLKDWSIERLLKSDRIILRMATFEMLHSDTPEKLSSMKLLNLLNNLVMMVIINLLMVF